jgi:hypothetical protein
MFCATSSGLGTLSLSSSHLRPLRAITGGIITQTAEFLPEMDFGADFSFGGDFSSFLPELEVDFFKESSLLGVDLF